MNLSVITKICKIAAQEGNYVLRIHRPKPGFAPETAQHSPEALGAELEFILALGKDMPFPLQRPVPNLEGELVTQLDLEGKSAAATLLTWLPGRIMSPGLRGRFLYPHHLLAMATHLHNPSYRDKFLRRTRPICQDYLIPWWRGKTFTSGFKTAPWSCFFIIKNYKFHKKYLNTYKVYL